MMKEEIIAKIDECRQDIPAMLKKLDSDKLTNLQKQSILNYIRKYSLKHFIPYVFGICDQGTKYIHNWHISLIAEYLEAVFRGQIKRLIINIPPRSLKSISTSVAFPAWILGHNPTQRFTCVSGIEATALDLSMKTRQVCSSEHYQKMFPTFEFAGDQNQKGSFNTIQNGCRVINTSLTPPTGLGYNFIIFDDFLTPRMSKREMATAIKLYPHFYSRLQSKSDDVIIVIEQRLGYNDFTANLKELWGDKAEYISLPAMETESRSIGFCGTTIERHEGQLLFENNKNWSRDTLLEVKKEMGSIEYETQYQQNPMIEGGNIVQRSWLQYESLATMQARKFEAVYISCDTAYKDKECNDPAALLVFGVLQNKLYLIDRHVERLVYPHLKEVIKKLAEKHKPKAILIEDKSSGQAIIPEFKISFRQYNPIPIMPRGDKSQRLSAASPFMEAGNLVLPEDAEWILDFENELLGFPNTKFDDQVDSCSQMINWFTERQRRPKADVILSAFSNIF